MNPVNKGSHAPRFSTPSVVVMTPDMLLLLLRWWQSPKGGWATGVGLAMLQCCFLALPASVAMVEECPAVVISKTRAGRAPNQECSRASTSTSG
ncbi:hypothetical protein E2C01_050473 [Portunus trituberculatus]|uniref:Uncharacterized protein n=1 Tax=Portunus trituberculatus TaxID=210409 RepID=A0A5B7GC71_PORTR|nr:hypothetical protein [Portunus trituberculatus]